MKRHIQFLMVRLREIRRSMQVLRLYLFQFLMVRLRGGEKGQGHHLQLRFQFLMVRLRVVVEADYSVGSSVDFNSLWFD